MLADSSPRTLLYPLFPFFPTFLRGVTRDGLGKRSLRLQDVENFVSCAAGLEQGLALVVANSSGEGERGSHCLLSSKLVSVASAAVDAAAAAAAAAAALSWRCWCVLRVARDGKSCFSLSSPLLSEVHLNFRFVLVCFTVRYIDGLETGHICYRQ